MLHEGPDKEEEQLNGVRAQMVLLAGEGRNEEESGRGQSGSGAAAAEREGAEELSGEGPSPAGASGLMDNHNPEGTSSSRQENEKQPGEPVPKDMEVAESVRHVPVVVSGVQPVSVLVRHRCFQHKFTPRQLQELERIFQQNHFIGAEERKQLARWIGVTEARVQNWFKGRREQYRRQQKL
ncbi:rhox homeobox family member 2-like [Meriones unguiculatus]|nr:rhox homeobox family member 2-like [Meriones unguiculatus]